MNTLEYVIIVTVYENLVKLCKEMLQDDRENSLETIRNGFMFEITLLLVES